MWFQAAHAWVMLTSRVVSNEAGMGTSNAAGLAFRIRRLVREYDTSEGRSFGRLSVAGTVPAKAYKPSQSNYRDIRLL